MAYVSEQGHYYWPDGRPAYEMPNKSKGGMRPTTVRDCRKHNLCPSVTTILNIAAKHQLERWKANQLMMAALTLPHIEGESLKDFEARIWEDSQAQSKEARDKGTEIHGYIERYFQTEDWDEEKEMQANPYVKAVREALIDEFGVQKWCAEKSFASPLRFGGKLDLHSPNVIIDYKTKDKIDFKKSMSYIENKMQLSAYRKGLELPNAKIANLYIKRELEDGKAIVKLEIHDGDWWDEFECLLRFWQLNKL